jgi:translation initiation factor 1
MSKNKINLSGIVYSTNPDFKPEEEHPEESETISPKEQRLRIKLETKHRAGKMVTLIEGFVGKHIDKEELIKKLKNHCGTGGSAKDGELLVQGDQREKVLQWLQKNGYSNAKKNN